MTTATMTAVTTKMPSQPRPARGSAYIKAWMGVIRQFLLFSGKQGQDHAAGNDRGNLAGDIDPHRVHQQEVLVVLGQPHLVDDPGGHGEGRNARRTDHGVDLGLGEEVVDLGHQNTAHRVKDKGHQTQAEDHEGFGGEEIGGLHLGGDGQAQEEGDEVGQILLGGLGKAFQHAAFPDQVAEHQKSDEGHAAGGHQTGDDGDEDGEKDLGALADLFLGVGHPDFPLRLSGHQPDHRGLDDGNQRHVGVGHHNDGAQIVGGEVVGHKDGGGTVRRADDGDGGRILDVKAQQGGHTEGEEDAELGRRAEEHQLGVGEQRGEVDHGADAHKEQQREELVGDAGVKQDAERPNLGDPFHHLGNRPRHGKVDQNGAETDGQQQRRLHLLLDAQVDEQCADGPHDNLLPLQVQDVAEHGFHGLILLSVLAEALGQLVPGSAGPG